MLRCSLHSHFSYGLNRAGVGGGGALEHFDGWEEEALMSYSRTRTGERK